MIRSRALLVVVLGVAWGCGEPTANPANDTTGEESESLGANEDSETETEGETETETETGESLPDLPSEALSDCDRLTELLDALAAEADPGAQTTLIDEFVRTVSYGAQGFPIVEANKLAVVYRGAPGQALSVAGDFNDWDASAAPLNEAAPGFYYANIEIDQPSGLYKLVRDQTEFFADPLARRFAWDDFGEYSQIDALPDRGHHERWLNFDQSAGELAPRTVTVYLPPGADAGPALPVLYMHDGQNLFAPDALFGGWRVSETVEQAVANATLEPMIIVGIDNSAARFDEYTQVSDVLDGTQYGGRADEYVEFLADGIMPFIAQRYPISTDPDQVALMGSSLGGLVSLYIGLRHPELFGHVASMSGTVDWGSFGADNPTILMDYAEAPPVGLQIYLDSGGGEGLGCPAGGSDNYCGNVVLAEALRGWGWVDEEDLFYRWAPGAPHNEAAWAERLLPALVDWSP